MNASQGHSKQADGVTLLLPWLDSNLSPNARLHWAAKAKRTREYKAYVGIVVNDAMHQRGEGLEPPCTAQWVFVPPDKRRRDVDNMVSNTGMKAAVDACVLFGLLVDDNSKVLTWKQPEVWTAYPGLKGPGVVLLLDEVEG